MEPEKKSNGAMLGLVVIIIILVLGVVYVLMSSKNTAPVPAQNSQVGAAPTNQDATALDSLDSDYQSTDANVGVDANTVQ